MKCEGFSQITDLVDYLTNNLLIAHYCGFNVTKPLPSYWTFDRFIRKLDNQILKDVMQSQVLKPAELGIVDTSFIGLDSTPEMANTKQNNPKSFAANKFSKDNQPKSDPDCRLGVHTASNQHDERKYEFYWGYKNHVLCDLVTGLPIYELTTPTNTADSTVALDILSHTHSFLPIDECTFVADKPICNAGLAMHRDGKFSSRNRTQQKFCCPFKRSSHIHDCPCNHRCFKKGSTATGCTKYVTIPDDYRLSINRDAAEFKSVYALRTECERYNSRFKATGQERFWVRNGNSATNLNTVAHISLLAIAIAAVITKSDVSYRCLKSVKRVA